MSACEKQIELSVLLQVCSHTKHSMAAAEKAIEVAHEHECMLTDFAHFPHGEEEISDEPFVELDFLAPSMEQGKKAMQKLWELVPDVFSASCNCRCDHCTRGLRAKIAAGQAMAEPASKAVH